MCEHVEKAEKITIRSFDGETKQEGKKLERRAVSLSNAVRAYLKTRTMKLAREIAGEVKETGNVLRLKKAKRMTKEQKKLLRLLSFYGIRQITDSGKEFAGSEWVIPNTFVSDYLSQKEILIQQLDASIEKEFRQAVSSAVEGLAARARMIARTEINAARNYGRVEAGKLMGRTHLVWLAYNDGQSGKRQHDALDGQIVEMGKPFKNPKTGAQLLYPGDPQATQRFRRGGKVVRGNAASEIINCRCSVRPITAQMAERLRGR